MKSKNASCRSTELTKYLVSFSGFGITLHQIPSYLYKETKNSETIFVVECLHNVGIFSIVANKVQLLK